jgi:hypothetical protein
LLRIIRSNSVLDRIPSDANVLSDPLVSNALEPDRLFCRGGPNAGEGDDRASGEDRPKVKLHLVYEALIQGLAKYFATAFYEHTRDLFLAKFAQNGFQVFSAMNDRPLGESIRKKPGTAGESARARENDAPRLLRPARSRRETRIVGPQCSRAN